MVRPIAGVTLRLCGKLFQISIDSENLKDKNDEVANVC